MANQINKVLLKQIALRLKQLRMSKKLTQNELYEDTGINIGRIERGINDLSISSLSRICDYFEITIEEFFKEI